MTLFHFYLPFKILLIPQFFVQTQKNQAAKLEMIANTNPKLFRGYTLKEQLRLSLKLSNIDEAKAELKTFFWKATHSRIKVFKELAYKIRRHEEHILNTIETKLSNARRYYSA